MDTNIKDKNDVLQRIDAVCKTLDGGIAVSGAQNAGNLAACFTILQETLAFWLNVILRLQVRRMKKSPNNMKAR